MIYLLAAIGALTIAVLLWRAFGPERVGVASRTPVAPDDDPDFLRKLGEQQPKKSEDD
ncbi:hypothetical protein GCM10027445_65300 [Amycolatopsis endophytica]|uniref:Uncharacterized protein n=1 Tax=Amycolatopsis endophytica TaxID=860233 RepID=A0A853AZ41_9PSEU|nr:hypothetical protein [Amycolatopsis endophytica]NYI87990.1 hypothetical protein [Amycolatopsis endophytica]